MLFDPDVRAMIRFLGDLSGSDQELSVKRPELLAQLCELIEGDDWSWTLERIGAARQKQVCLEALSGGRASRLRLVPLPDIRPLARTASDPHLTLTVRQISDDLVSTIRFARAAGRVPFTDRDIKMAQVILSEIPWLHERHPGTAAPAIGQMPGKLAPRQQAVLLHWVDGLTSRAIAERLRISPYTVQDYIKGIYKHYRVNCRAELLRQITLGWEQRKS